MRRIVVIGLDSAPPEILFDKLRNKLPNIDEMMRRGAYARLRTCNPPITVPAWMVMFTGRDPGALGLYGFRHRKGHSYRGAWIVNSASVKERAIWDMAGDEERRVAVVGIPPSYPPRQVNGICVSCFLTPESAGSYTYPPDLKGEVEAVVGQYEFDVEFRVEDRDSLLSNLHRMTEKHFKLIRHLLLRDKWDFFACVEIGVDRVQHSFWKFFDARHRKYVRGNRYENVIADYYALIDREIGKILSIADDAVVLIVSDHGAKAMRGAISINEWLIQQGYLSLRSRPGKVVDLDEADVDWDKTVAWGWGGYYARIFLNVKGREESGVVKRSEYQRVRDEIAERLRHITDPDGRPMRVQVFKPEELFKVCNGDAPDLMVYFDDLNYRSAGTIGHGRVFLDENDTGPDDAVHSMDGVFLIYDPKREIGKDLGTVDILDVAPTILSIMGLQVPKDLPGRPVSLG